MINSEVLTLADQENGDVSNSMKKSRVVIYYSTREMVDNKLCIIAEYELEALGTIGPVLRKRWKARVIYIQVEVMGWDIKNQMCVG